MELGLKGKVAIVTGASRGIGAAIAEMLAEEGMHVVAAARTEALLAVLVDKIGARGGIAHAEVADLSRDDTPGDLVAATIKRWDRLDLVVNNAGATKRGDFFALDEADWRDGFALKFFGAVRLCRAAWPHLVASRGAIVNIAGVGGRTASADFTIGGSVNAALLNFTKALADRGVREGVRVNAINPGFIDTARLRDRVNKVAADAKVPVDDVIARLCRERSVSRIGAPAEIATAVAFLAGAPSAYVNGAIIDIDGGMTRTL